MNIYINTCLKVIVAHPLLKVTFLVSMNQERPTGKKYISWQVIPDKLMNLNEEDAKWGFAPNVYQTLRLMCASNSLWQPSPASCLLIWLASSPAKLLLLIEERMKASYMTPENQGFRRWCLSVWEDSSFKRGKLWLKTFAALQPCLFMTNVRKGNHWYKTKWLDSA